MSFPILFFMVGGTSYKKVQGLAEVSTLGDESSDAETILPTNAVGKHSLS